MMNNIQLKIVCNNFKDPTEKTKSICNKMTTHISNSKRHLNPKKLYKTCIKLVVHNISDTWWGLRVSDKKNRYEYK